MVETPGICTQTGACEMAGQGRIFTVALGSPFVCPGCGHGLVPPVQLTEVPQAGMSPLVPVALTLGAVLLLGGAIFLGRQLGVESSPPPARTVAASVATPASVAQAPAARAPATVASVATKPAAADGAPLPAPAAIPSAAPAVQPPISAAGPATTKTQVAQIAPPPATPDHVLPPANTAPPPPSLPAPQPTGAPTPQPVASVGAAQRPVAPGAAQPAAPASATQPLPAAAAQAERSTSPKSATGSALLAPVPSPTRVPAPPSVQLALRASPQVPPPAATAPAVPDVPFNPVPLAGGTPDYPASLAVDGRPGRVTVTCVIQGDGRPQGCRTGLARGGPAFAASALSWLERGRVRFRVPVLHGHAAPGPQSWVVAIEEPPAALAEARRRARAAEEEEAVPVTPPPPLAQDSPPARPAPVVVPALARQSAPHAVAGINRGFSAKVIGGGAPAYPKAYEDESRSGQVLVRCTIEQDGAPSGCAVLAQTGGQNFGRAVRDWLGSGRVRFAPILADGQPVSQVQTWTVSFQPPAQ